MYCQNSSFFVGDNIRPVIESADNVTMFRCIAVLCHCVNKNDRKYLFCWRQCKNNIFIALIHPIQWTIATLVSADRPAKCQKKMSCVSTGWPVPVLCTPQMAPRTSFLSRQPDVIASFSFGACTVQTCFQQSPDILRKNVDYDGFSTLLANILL